MKWIGLVYTTVAVVPLVAAQWDNFAPCTQQCYGDLVAKGASLGCPGGEDACLCGNQLFQDGVQDCVSQLCPSQDPGIQVTEEVNKIKSFCIALIGQDPTATPTSVPTAEDPAATPAPSEGVPPTDTPAIPTTEDVPEATPEPSSPAESADPTAADPTGASPTSDNASPTATEKNNSSTTNSANKDTAKNGDDKSDDNESTGLSTTTKIAIGAGVGGGALLLTIVAAILMCRRKQKQPLGRKISDPLPGSGRYKAQSVQPARVYVYNEKNASELEMTSRRYEDMLPRQQPRQMV